MPTFSIEEEIKYPTVFNSADFAVITKIDLAAAVEFDEAARNGQHTGSAAEHAGVQGIAKNGRGMDDYLRFLAQRRAALALAQKIGRAAPIENSRIKI